MFASVALRELAECGHRPALVISQPDRRRGRGLCGTAPEAVCEARGLGIPVLQTENINSPVVVEQLGSAGISILAVAAFGQILRDAVVDGFLCVNIHGSILPKYRGPAPIERALMAGDTETGVSIMRVTRGVDEGPWAEQVTVPIGLEEDAGDLGHKLAVIGAQALARVLDTIDEGRVAWNRQSGNPSYAGKIGLDDCRLDVRGEAKRAHDQVRALSPCIGAKVDLGGVEVKVWRSRPLGGAGSAEVPNVAQEAAGQAGALVAVDKRLFVGCGVGVLEILEIQPLNKARMSASEFLRGYSGRLAKHVSMEFTESERNAGLMKEGSCGGDTG